MTAVFKLIATTQKYDWGKIGLSSKVAQYAAACKLPGFTLDEKAPYAEVSTLLLPLIPNILRTSARHRALTPQIPIFPAMDGHAPHFALAPP